MITNGSGLEFNLLWHWVFIAGFAFTTFINMRAKSIIGTGIGLAGVIICVASLIIKAL
ncbi:hypothetical protein MFLO_11500 [Listeria floridensis FSL S10-1187]|uniref:Uncharacterized protein n=1 Tax=Listeria floridensis FSL S10-1187 TaxID=1265817 RepID=A0ABP3AWH4_9LIST|nr:hypothetical protein MFLO_11500 [Listeria floridensis FSL S10-1187]